MGVLLQAFFRPGDERAFIWPRAVCVFVHRDRVACVGRQEKMHSIQRSVWVSHSLLSL